MKMLYDLFPVLLFFVAYKWQDIYTATAVLILASLVQTIVHRLRQGRFETSHLITLALVLVFGGATLLLHDELFIKWKPTVINWLFGIAFLASHWIGNKPIIARMLDTKIDLPETVWRRLNAGWGTFFLVLGALNLYVAFAFDTDTWVNFKLFGLMGLTLLFIIAQSIYLAKHLQTEQSTDRGRG
ncbi:MAG: septation protein A [Zetaproteobacteria bacterium]|nr:MAG: septation protein A [Zetaproteobacteria bacterium]